MNIELRKYGTTLVFRDRGQEAFEALMSTFDELPEKETVTVDFSGVVTFSPSWGDEFLTPLSKKYQDRLLLKNASNPSVKATLKTLTEVKGLRFNLLD